MVLLETPVLQKPHLARSFLEVGGRGITKFLDALLPGQGVPIRISFCEGMFYSGIRYATLPQIKANADRTFALIDARLDEAVGKSLIALQAIAGQLRDCLFRNVAVEPFGSQLPDQLSLAVVTARQKVHGFLSRFEGRRKTIFPRFGEKIADFFVEFRHSGASAKACPGTQYQYPLGSV